MALKIDIPQTLNEAIIGKCNMEVPDKKVEVTGTVPIVYADAINTHQDTVEKIEDDFKEKDKEVDDIVKDNEKQVKERSKMKLSESLFECDDVITEDTETKLYKRAENISDEIDALLADFGSIDNIDDYIIDSDFDVLNRAVEVLQDFAMAYSHIMDNEDVFESLEDEDKIRKEYKELKDQAAKYGDNVPEDLANKLHAKAMEFADAKINTHNQDVRKKFVEDDNKRSRGTNEKPEDKLINQVADDKELTWMKVYDELSATLDNEGEGKDVDKELKAKRGERYEEVYPGPGDNTIIVYAPSLEDFAFAKKVADHYGVKADQPKAVMNAKKNDYYKYSMLIRV